jgi:hypothetical protein
LNNISQLFDKNQNKLENKNKNIYHLILKKYINVKNLKLSKENKFSHLFSFSKINF